MPVPVPASQLSGTAVPPWQLRRRDSGRLGSTPGGSCLPWQRDFLWPQFPHLGPGAMGRGPEVKGEK